MSCHSYEDFMPRRGLGMGTVCDVEALLLTQCLSSLVYERVYLPLFHKVVDTPFHIQRDVCCGYIVMERVCLVEVLLPLFVQGVSC